MKRFILSALAVAGLAGLSGQAFGQEIQTQWAFDGSNVATTGSGTVSYVGAAFSSPFANSGGGAPNDPAYPTTSNIYIQWNGAFPTDANGADSIRFSASTGNNQGITFSWDQEPGYRASRYYQLQVTTDGVNWNPVSGGVGGNATSLGAGTASATVSNSGLITIIDNDPANNAGGQTGITAAQSTADFNDGLSYTLPAGPWENNPNRDRNHGDLQSV